MVTSRLRNVFRTLAYARRGVGLRNQCLLFFLAGFGGINTSRLVLRQWFARCITSFGDGRFVDLRFEVLAHTLAFSLRQGNEGDYLIGSEFVKDVYELPDFAPEQIIDGGANIGLFSVVAAAMFPQARLTCYEPDPANYEQLQRNLKLNRVNAEHHRLGLWSRTTTLYYHARRSHTGFISEAPAEVHILCVLPEIGRDCWLKLDVEAAEYEVLPALLNHGQHPRWITMEVHNYVLQGQSLIALLRQHGYTIKGDKDKTADCVNITAWRSTS